MEIKKQVYDETHLWPMNENTGRILIALQQKVTFAIQRKEDPVLINLFKAVNHALHSSQSEVVIPTWM